MTAAARTGRSDETIIVFARPPIAGRVKSRLARFIGEGPTLSLYLAFLEDTCALVAQLAVERVLAVADEPDAEEAMRLLDTIARRYGMRVASQGEGDLGARIDRALTAELLAARRVCVVGTDAPSLQLAFLSLAFAELDQHEVVIGPARDGGYWLIGARRPQPQLFVDMRWGEPTVLSETLRRLPAETVSLLPLHADVDDAEGLVRLANELVRLPSTVAPLTRTALAAIAGPLASLTRGPC